MSTAPSDTIPPLTNHEIAAAFAELAERLAFSNEPPFRIAAFATIAETFATYPHSLAVLAREGRLREIDGVGPGIEDQVTELIATGTMSALELARRDVPDVLVDLARLPGIGAKTARKIAAAMDGASLIEITAAAREGSLPKIPGVGAKVITALVDARAVVVDSEAPPTAFRRNTISTTAAALREVIPESAVEIAGEMARGLDIVSGLDVIVTTTQPVDVLISALTERGWMVTISDTDPTVVVGAAPSGVPVVLHTTQSSSSVIRDRAIGPKEWAVAGTDSRVPAELRDRVLAGVMSAEEAASRALVTETDLIADLHTHSSWTDGSETILEMARAARAQGNTYIVLTDHSAPYALVGGLDGAALARQAQEIAEVNDTLAADEATGDPPMRVVRGSEVEILGDGSLGLPDDVLAQLDWVIASIHAAQRQDADTIRRRMERVLANPLVDCIGHPTSRLTLQRPPTALDVSWLIDVAAERGVVLEINANPRRLDLSPDHALEALAAGCRLAVNTDAHRRRDLLNREHGVAVARRAGAERSQIVNTYTPDKLEEIRPRNR